MMADQRIVPYNPNRQVQVRSRPVPTIVVVDEAPPRAEQAKARWLAKSANTSIVDGQVREIQPVQQVEHIVRVVHEQAQLDPVSDREAWERRMAEDEARRTFILRRDELHSRWWTSNLDTLIFAGIVLIPLFMIFLGALLAGN
jgi:hypothetical protein